MRDLHVACCSAGRRCAGCRFAIVYRVHRRGETGWERTDADACLKIGHTTHVGAPALKKIGMHGRWAPPSTSVRVVVAFPRRCLSSPPRANDATLSATVEDAPSSLPPWLSRWLHIWDRESGTHEIIHLKRQVNRASNQFDQQQNKVLRARKTLEQALEQWEGVQAQHTTLLQTRERWTPSHAKEFAGGTGAGGRETWCSRNREERPCRTGGRATQVPKRLHGPTPQAVSGGAALAGQMEDLQHVWNLGSHSAQFCSFPRRPTAFADGSSNSDERGCEESANGEEKKQALDASSGSLDESVEVDVDGSETDQQKASGRRRAADDSTSRREEDSSTMTLRRTLQSHKEAIQSRLNHIKPEMVDLPSAALGASVTALAWVAVALSSRRDT
ncbi:hypothetical protein THAOC_36394 [Thalassiosira oceanica]|uniref:Uncharacterized protein n=1 Tax=Thalassiosira oceanica TaxID=159749 RepID=K0R1Y1_THAOC|nr:hypothetical protein THAOC_36394 [Thalassiosira oceanica]|eukprot:EJK45024.1 hypothetical protein THAOC_36394 [Thalassiosira oceanica]